MLWCEVARSLLKPLVEVNFNCLKFGVRATPWGTRFWPTALCDGRVDPKLLRFMPRPPFAIVHRPPANARFAHSPQAASGARGLKN